MYPGLMAERSENGPDIIVPAGGGMLGHPMGYKAGAMAWRQAIDAVMADVSLEDAAKSSNNGRDRGAPKRPRRHGAIPGRVSSSSRRRISGR